MEVTVVEVTVVEVTVAEQAVVKQKQKDHLQSRRKMAVAEVRHCRNRKHFALAGAAVVVVAEPVVVVEVEACQCQRCHQCCWIEGLLVRVGLVAVVAGVVDCYQRHHPGDQKEVPVVELAIVAGRMILPCSLKEQVAAAGQRTLTN